MNEQSETIAAPVIKVITVWSLVGLSSVQEAATWAALISSIVAITYTTILLGEWMWKRIFRSVFELLGWIKPRLNLMTESEFDQLKGK